MKKKMMIVIASIFVVFAIVLYIKVSPDKTQATSDREKSQSITGTQTEKEENKKEDEKEQPASPDDASGTNIEDNTDSEMEVDQDGNVIFRYSGQDRSENKGSEKDSKKDSVKTDGNKENDKHANNEKDTEENKKEDIKLEDGGIELPVVPAE